MYTETKEHCLYCNWDGIRLTMCKPCEDVEQEKISKAYDELIAWEKEQDVHNNAILSKLGKRVKKSFAELMEWSTVTGKIEIVTGPSGYYQNENIGSFKKIHVDQWAVGIEGDSWEGFIYTKTRIGWLKIPYSC